MHMDVQMKYISELTDVRRTRRGEGHSSARLRSPMEQKYYVIWLREGREWKVLQIVQNKFGM